MIGMGLFILALCKHTHRACTELVMHRTRSKRDKHLATESGSRGVRGARRSLTPMLLGWLLSPAYKLTL